MRLFIALPCPPEVKSAIKNIQCEIASCGEIKLVKKENIHVTLKFLGEVSEEKADKITEALSQLSGQESFTVCVKGIGVFPKPSFPRVVWAGVSKGSEEIVRMHTLVDGMSQQLGFKEDNLFHPHATIARVRHLTDREKLAHILKTEKDTEYGTYKAASIHLMESKLSPKGPAYNILKEVSLQ